MIPAEARPVRLVFTVVALLALSPFAAAQPGPLSSRRQEPARLDALLAAGDSAGAEALLQALEPELAKNDRLAFDTIYVLLARGRVPEARAQWNRLAARLKEGLHTSQAGAVTPGEALFTQALLLARGGEKHEALKLLQQADGLGFPPLDSPLMLMAADCLRDLQEFELAASAYREFLKGAPSNTGARLGLASALYAARRFSEAQKELEELLRLAPRTPMAHYFLGAVLVEQTRYDEARRHLARELERDPRCLACLSRLAHLAYLEGNDPQCESLLARASALDPADVETRMVSGLLAFRQERYQAAIDHLSRVVERSPDYSVAHYQLAMAYRRAGEAEKAREHFDTYQRLLKEQRARQIGFRGER